MNHRTVKIYDTDDFEKITKGIKVALCMRVKSSPILDTEKLLNNLEELSVSEALSCSFCSTEFENKPQQRLHYKLDWHRFNLKQRLNGLRPISECSFNQLNSKECEYVCESENSESEKNNSVDTDTASSKWKSKRSQKKVKNSDAKSETSDVEYMEEDDEDSKNDALTSHATRHSKVFFENEEGDIFSIYRCLLHNKKEIPETESEMIVQALKSGKKSYWTIVMVGGGHFAGAVFFDGKPVAHKTFHNYTVRAKQGSSQSTRDNRNASAPRSGGASLRRHNESSLLQNIQDHLESWSSYIADSVLILYRATGPYNRTVLFGGKNAPLDKSDPRLRALPFPTRKATLNEIKRVYDILSNVEIYGSAADFTDNFPISPRQPIRQKTVKDTSKSVNGNKCAKNVKELENDMNNIERQKKQARYNIDRAKPRKSPHRPLPDIVARLAVSSSDSELELPDDSSSPDNIEIIEQYDEINLISDLKVFDGTPKCVKRKNRCRQKKSVQN